MKNVALAAVLVALMIGCASGMEKGPAVTFAIEQIPIPLQSLRFGGGVNVQYVVTVRNNTDEPVRLQRLDVKTIGTGAYMMRQPNVPVNLTVAPHASGTSSVSAWGTAPGGTIYATEPVTVYATAYLVTQSFGPFIRAATIHFQAE